MVAIMILCVIWIVLIIWQIFLTLRKTKLEIQLEKRLSSIESIAECAKDKSIWLEKKYYDFWEAATMRIDAETTNPCLVCSRVNNCTRGQINKETECGLWEINSKVVFRIILDKIFKKETENGLE